MIYKSKNIILIAIVSFYPNPKKFLKHEVDVGKPMEEAPSIVYSIN